MRLRIACISVLLALVFAPRVGISQHTVPPRHSVDLQRLVEFNFINSDIAEVLYHFVQLTGWSVFYDAARVTGTVTIITPGKVPLEQALRLVQGVMHTNGYAIRVLTPSSPQPVPLATVLTEISHPSERRDVVVWRNSDARGPQSRPYDCDKQSGAYPLSPFWVDVIVDRTR